MGILQGFKNIFAPKNLSYAKLLDSHTPIFSQFGQNVYASDVVQICVDIIASECSKLQLRHIRTNVDGTQTVPKSSYNRLFKFAPNELMTTRDFLEKVIWQLFMNYNSFIYPVYDKGQCIAIYPLNPHTVEFLEDTTGKLFIHFYFTGNIDVTIPYSEVIHLRKKFSSNSVMGGGINGQADNGALLKVLEINDVVTQGLGKAIKTSLSIRGILKINTMLDDEKQKKEREKLETLIATGTSGIIPMDLKGEYTPLQIDPKIIDKDTIEFLQHKILNWYGVSMPIFNGDFNDEQYQAFYEKTLEPRVISIAQAFSKTLFTQRELDQGNEICVYQKDMQYLSAKTKLELLKTAGEQGILTDNQKLAIIGYPPLEDGTGNRRTMSLNYIDVNLVNQYQMSKSNQEGVMKIEK